MSATAWPLSAIESRRVAIAHVPVEATMFGEPVRPHVRRLMADALLKNGHEVISTIVRDQADIQSLAQSAPDALVLNLCYGLRSSSGEHLSQPRVAAAIEHAGLALVGSGSEAQLGCQDKTVAARVAAAIGIGVPEEFTLDAAVEQRRPLIVKPREGAAHRDVRLVSEPAELLADPPGPEMMIQEYLDGPEYTIGVIGNECAGVRVLPLTRVRVRREGTTPAIYDWTTTTMAPDSGARFGLAKAAASLFDAYGLVDYARFDFRVVADRGPVLMDANALPNLAPRQLLATSARWCGINYPDLIEGLVTASALRHDASTSSVHGRVLR